nr:glutathione S-transferase family protein [uncultured Gellertiella sp.]
MILIGQYDSPFVRRVGIALKLYDLPFDHRPWSVFGDTDAVRDVNPVTRVPALILDDGDVLIESHMMLDYLDSLVPAAARLFPVEEPGRHRALKVAALAMGLAEKAVSLFYEHRLHSVISEVWSGRCTGQIRAAAAALDAERAGHETPWWFGDRLGHADIAVGVAVRFVRDAHPGLLDEGACPALFAHWQALEQLEVFREITQEFVAPA